MKNLLIIGSTGMIGSRIANEARTRGHSVTEASRSGGDGRLSLDASNPDAVANAAAGHDVIISAISPPRDGTPPEPAFLATGRSVIEGARAANVARLLVVGGAGSLLLPDDTRVVDQDWFPAEVAPEALAHVALLDVLRDEASDLDWAYLSPPGQIEPGDRTGKVTLGRDHAVGESISAEDYAMALIDEVDQGTHSRQRFTVASG